MVCLTVYHPFKCQPKQNSLYKDEKDHQSLVLPQKSKRQHRLGSNHIQICRHGLGLHLSHFGIQIYNKQLALSFLMLAIPKGGQNLIPNRWGEGKEGKSEIIQTKIFIGK